MLGGIAMLQRFCAVCATEEPTSNRDRECNERQIRRVPDPDACPQRGDTQREYHRLDKQPKKTKALASVARDDLAHQQRTDHVQLNAQRPDEWRVVLECHRVMRACYCKCSRTLASRRLRMPQARRPISNTVTTDRKRRGSIAISGRLG